MFIQQQGVAMSHHKKSDAVAHDRVDPAVKQNLVMPIVRVLADMKKQFGSLIFMLASVFVLAACSGGTSTSTTVSGTTSYTNNNLLVSHFGYWFAVWSVWNTNSCKQ